MSGAGEVEELRERLAALERVLSERDELIASLHAQLDASRARVAELEARLGMNSGNSSKPPASDSPFEKPAPKSLRGRSGRKPGGQPGHEGRTLRQVADPDEVIVHEPGACRCCGADLSGRPVSSVTRRQSFDIPPVKIIVTEHRMRERECACGARTRADAPYGVLAPVSYGPRVGAIVVYLYAGQMLSKDRTATAVAELFDTPVSAGTVATLARRAADGLHSFLDLVRERIAGAGVAHFDETGLRVAGKLRWVHSASTHDYSLITCHDKRGVAAMDDAGVLPGFTGVAVHDAWAPYDTYTDADHALCNAHALRELQAVTDSHADDADPDQCWSAQLSEVLRAMKDLVDTAPESDLGLAGIDHAALDVARARYRAAARAGLDQTAARENKLTRKHHALAKRLIKREDDYLRFTSDPKVSFDNNAAEREIRMIKLRQKVSGCLRTTSGAEQFCAIRSYVATARKHDLSLFNALTSLAEGHPWLPSTT
ncbi:MAG: IS66 family transposase [Streptosporangiales bacterium]